VKNVTKWVRAFAIASIAYFVSWMLFGVLIIFLRMPIPQEIAIYSSLAVAIASVILDSLRRKRSR
jgi:hypothetical protein